MVATTVALMGAIDTAKLVNGISANTAAEKNKYFIASVYTGRMYIKVVVTAGAKREILRRLSDTKLAISVTEPAKQNLANRRVVALVATHFGVPVAKVRIISGHHSPSKMLSVDR